VLPAALNDGIASALDPRTRWASRQDSVGAWVRFLIPLQLRRCQRDVKRALLNLDQELQPWVPSPSVNAVTFVSMSITTVKLLVSFVTFVIIFIIIIIVVTVKLIFLPVGICTGGDRAVVMHDALASGVSPLSGAG
jgi:hypothetical protein